MKYCLITKKDYLNHSMMLTRKYGRTQCSVLTAKMSILSLINQKEISLNLIYKYNIAIKRNMITVQVEMKSKNTFLLTSKN